MREGIRRPTKVKCDTHETCFDMQDALRDTNSILCQQGLVRCPTPQGGSYLGYRTWRGFLRTVQIVFCPFCGGRLVEPKKRPRPKKDPRGVESRGGKWFKDYKPWCCQ